MIRMEGQNKAGACCASALSMMGPAICPRVSPAAFVGSLRASELCFAEVNIHTERENIQIRMCDGLFLVFLSLIGCEAKCSLFF